MASIFPPSLQTPFLKAFEEFVNERFNAIPLQNIAMYIVDVAPAEALYYLAEQFDVLGLRGFKYAITEEQKRNVIKNALEAHRYSGTNYAIRKALEGIGLIVDYIEEGVGDYYIHNGQYFYDGTITYGSLGHWAYFNVYIQTQGGSSISALQLQEARDIINEFKPMHAHLKELIVSPREVFEQITITDSIDIEVESAIYDSFGALYNGQYTHDGSITYGTGMDDSVDITPEVADEDARAFLLAANITDTDISIAIQYLVVTLKNSGVWAKTSALYPMVGGDADTHKLNLKDPRDIDAAFRINFVGGISHTSSGVQGNGVNGYGDTYFSPRNNAAIGSLHMSFFTPSNSTAVGVQMGVFSNSFGNYSFMAIRNSSTQSGWMNNNAVTLTTLSPTPVNGMYINTRTDTSGFKVFKNGSLLAESTSAIAAQTNPLTMYICANHGQNAPLSFSTQIISFASLGQGLTEAESIALSDAVTTFQTMLGR